MDFCFRLWSLVNAITFSYLQAHIYNFKNKTYETFVAIAVNKKGILSTNQKLTHQKEWKGNSTQLSTFA